MNEETLGRRIAAHRKDLGLTQDSLAERLGVTAQAVSKWENNQSCPDIAMLPELAKIFGISVDTLLGLESPKEEPPKETAEDKKAEEDPPVIIPGQRFPVGVAVWLLLSGAILTAVRLFPAHLYPVSQWTVLGLTGLTVFGLMGLYPHFSVFRMGCGMAGGYYLYALLLHPGVMLNEDLLLPVLLIFFGLGLLVDGIRGKAVPGGHRDWSRITRNRFDCSGNRFDCYTCFGEGHRVIQLDALHSGTAEVEFGELSVDLLDCKTVDRDCSIFLKCSFGDLTLCVPRRWRLECANRTAFGTVDEQGRPDAEPEGTIRVESSVSFGQITIKYI